MSKKILKMFVAVLAAVSLMIAIDATSAEPSDSEVISALN